MQIAIIVLLIVAFVLAVGGLITYAVMSGKKKSDDTAASLAEDGAEKEIAEPAEEQAKPAEPVQEVQEEPVAEEVAPVTVETVPVAEEVTQPAPVAKQTEVKKAKAKPEAKNDNPQYIVIKYSKSFLAKLIQSGDVTKNYYAQLKNKLLSYKGVKSRLSWKWETFRLGRKKLAKMRLRGKTISVCLALNADNYAGTKYIVENISDVRAYTETPCLYRIKNARRAKYACELIDELMRANGVAANETAALVDYAAQHPYESTEALIERKLIKVLTDEEAQSGTSFKPKEILESVTVQEADELIEDEVAVTLIEKAEPVTEKSEKYEKPAKTKQDIINIDTLSHCFESGEVVTLAEIKKRVKGFDKRTTSIKVLARGRLDKALTVEADSFSIQAVKMIVLTGGKAIKK